LKLRSDRSVASLWLAVDRNIASIMPAELAHRIEIAAFQSIVFFCTQERVAFLLREGRKPQQPARSQKYNLKKNSLCCGMAISSVLLQN